MSSEMDLSDLLGVFLEEAGEQLQRLDSGILNLEKDPSDLDILNETFRAAHTIKGSSATMGLSPIADLTHAMENLLDSLRNGVLIATSGTVDLLLRGTDALRTLLDQVASGQQMDLDTEHLKSELRAACSPLDSGAASNDTERIDDKQDTSLMDMGGGIQGTIRLKLKVVDDCLMPSVRAFMIYNALSGLGEVVSADPPQDNLDDIQSGQEITISFLPSSDPGSVLDAMHRLSEVELIEAILNDDLEPAATPGAAESTAPASADAAPRTGEMQTESAARTIQTVRVGVDRLDTLMNLIAELVIDRGRINQIESELTSRYENEDLVTSLGETAAHIGRVVTELQEHIMKVRLLPVEQVFNRFPRLVRDLAHKAGKDVDFVLEGRETELDRSILEDIVDPITHLLRNAVDHGVETPEDRAIAGKPSKARVVLAAKQEENRIVIEVSDDGKGISVDKVRQAALKKNIVTEETLSRMSDDEALQLIFAPGLSTADKITDISGRGVGMDVVRSNIQGLSGSVEVHTRPGEGTTFRINLPLTLAIIQALVTGVDNDVYVIPLSAVEETFRCDASDVRYVEGRPAINFRGSVLPLVHLGSIFDNTRNVSWESSDSITFVVVHTGVLKVGFIVDRLIGEQEVVIKPLGSFFGDLPGIAGATVLGDGRVALILDVAGLMGLLNRRRYSRESVQPVEA